MGANPLQTLDGLLIQKRDRVPVEICGEKFLCRTRMTVHDVMALPGNFFALHPFAASVVLFRLLGLSENGRPLFSDDESDDWYYSLDALQIHRGVTQAGILKAVLEQLVPADDEAASAGKE